MLGQHAPYLEADLIVTLLYDLGKLQNSARVSWCTPQQCRGMHLEHNSSMNKPFWLPEERLPHF